MSSVLQKLTEGIKREDKRRETKVLVNKWQETGLLEGIEDERDSENMSILLENQAKELLREASTMSGGDVEGFAAVAFPLVRRVFGNLIANELVSVQPMSLPTGLVFFLDFRYNTTRLGAPANTSVFGGGVVGGQITGGVSLSGALGLLTDRSFYNMNNGYSSPTGSGNVTLTVVASGNVGSAPANYTSHNMFSPSAVGAYAALGDRLVRYDPDILSGTAVVVATAPISSFSQLDRNNLVAITGTTAGGNIVRRLTAISPVDSSLLMFVFTAGAGNSTNTVSSSVDGSRAFTWPENDNRTTGVGLGSLVGTSAWGLENVADIPEINLKVDSVDIQADTKKLKAKWTPELQQDLAAYQNVDAEVELTQILSEHVTLEIDRELLEDLIKGATAGTYYWSRRPGRFVDRTTGVDISSSANESLLGADFTGTVSEWYETLVETVNDVSAQIFRKTRRGGANFIVVGPEMANILEMTAGFRAVVSHDEEKGEVGTIKVGSIKKKWDVYVDSMFLRNVILIGRKGNSFLESGYVFAPYVPLQVSPTILGPEDFVPRKAVWTRYGKKMIMPDFYGLVVVKDFLG